MGHSTCCVVNCKNNGKNSNCKFYKFPKRSYKLQQRLKWITAVRRVNPDGSPWFPKPEDCICSAHFVGNKKSEEAASPSYVPTIFPPIYKSKVNNTVQALNRHNRYMKNRLKAKEQLAIKKKVEIPDSMDKIKSEEFHNKINNDCDLNNVQVMYEHKECQAQIPDIMDEIKSQPMYHHKECQANIFHKRVRSENILICNRYIFMDSPSNDVEIQTDLITDNSVKKIPNRKMFKDKQCGTEEKICVDTAVGPDSETTDDINSQYFTGIASIKNNEQLLDLAGVTENNFKFLLKRLCEERYNWKVSKENRLLIFLIKMKTGLTLSAISVLFGVHRSTVSRIFYSALQILSATTANLVFWPSKEAVQETMPECFYPRYSNTRVIIDCKEFRMEVPSNLDHRVHCYSHYKRTFTIKLLIGITPSGFISFKSKAAGGRKSDSQMTIKSGLIDLLEDNDVVLADKGFPQIQKTIDETGKKIILVMPPFLEKKSHFSKEETEETYEIAKVRIHVEIIMQRLRIYQILHKIPENLFPYIDNIIHMCCVLVNLQPSIISNKNEAQ